MTEGRKEDEDGEADVCGCCGYMVHPRNPDPWEGRMDDYCYECCLTRCDAYPGECRRNFWPSAAGTSGENT